MRKLAADLREAGVQVWLDEREIEAGESLIRSVAEGLSSADYVAACLSPDSAGSNWVIKELEIAVHMEIKGSIICVIPLLLPGFENRIMSSVS